MDFQDYKPYKHIYYLHGALFLFRGAHEDLKVRRNSEVEGLLQLISNALISGEVPLFVSEGTSEQKLRAISRSHYLRFCYDKLRAKREKLVMYGISLSRVQDQHIIDAIKRKTEHIAIAIYPGDKSAGRIRDELEDFDSKFPRIRRARSMSDHRSSRLIAAEPTKAAAVMRSSSLAARTRPSRIRTRWATVNIDRVSHYACRYATAIVGEDRFTLPRTGLPVGRGGQEDRHVRALLAFYSIQSILRSSPEGLLQE